MNFFFGVFFVFSTILFICLSLVAFTTLLFHIADLFEQYPEKSRQYLKLMIGIIIFSHLVVLLFGSSWTWTWRRAPISMILLGIQTHIVYFFFVLPKFPYISYRTPAFMISMVLCVISHIGWIRWFIAYAFDIDLMQILGFFMIYLWATPFAFLISLGSENLLSLPTAVRKEARFMDQVITSSLNTSSNNYVQQFNSFANSNNSSQNIQNTSFAGYDSYGRRANQTSAGNWTPTSVANPYATPSIQNVPQVPPQQTHLISSEPQNPYSAHSSTVYPPHNQEFKANSLESPLGNPLSAPQNSIPILPEAKAVPLSSTQNPGPSSATTWVPPQTTIPLGSNPQWSAPTSPYINQPKNLYE